MHWNTHHIQTPAKDSISFINSEKVLFKLWRDQALYNKWKFIHNPPTPIFFIACTFQLNCILYTLHIYIAYGMKTAQKKPFYERKSLFLLCTMYIYDTDTCMLNSIPWNICIILHSTFVHLVHSETCYTRIRMVLVHSQKLAVLHEK